MHFWRGFLVTFWSGPTPPGTGPGPGPGLVQARSWAGGELLPAQVTSLAQVAEFSLVRSPPRTPQEGALRKEILFEGLQLFDQAFGHFWRELFWPSSRIKMKGLGGR